MLFSSSCLHSCDLFGSSHIRLSNVSRQHSSTHYSDCEHLRPSSRTPASDARAKDAHTRHLRSVSTKRLQRFIFFKLLLHRARSVDESRQLLFSHTHATRHLLRLDHVLKNAPQIRRSRRRGHMAKHGSTISSCVFSINAALVARLLPLPPQFPKPVVHHHLDAPELVVRTVELVDLLKRSWAHSLLQKVKMRYC